MAKHIWNGREIKVKATYRNSPFYMRVLGSPSGCYLDKEKGELRVIFGRPYKPEMECMEVVEK